MIKNFLLAMAAILFFYKPQVSGSMTAAKRDPGKLDVVRAADTCADPSIARTVMQGWSPSLTAHVLEVRRTFLLAIAGGGDWQFQGDSFLAWTTQQESTVPFYRLNNPTTKDYIFLIANSTTGGLPIVPGYTVQTIIVYVYPTQICGSVPLYSVFNNKMGDHWYTTDKAEHDDLISLGYGIEGGIVAYVLPLNSGCSCD